MIVLCKHCAKAVKRRSLKFEECSNGQVCWLCLGSLPSMSHTSLPSLVEFVESKYSGSYELYCRLIDSRATDALSVSLSPILLVTSYVVLGSDSFLEGFEAIKATAKRLVVEALKANVSDASASSSTTDAHFNSDNRNKRKRSAATGSQTGSLRAYVSIHCPTACYPPSLGLCSSPKYVKSLLKSQKKTRLRDRCPNIIGGVSGTVEQNLQSRVYFECGVDVDTEEYARSIMRAEDVKVALKKERSPKEAKVCLSARARI